MRVNIEFDRPFYGVIFSKGACYRKCFLFRVYHTYSYDRSRILLTVSCRYRSHVQNTESLKTNGFRSRTRKKAPVAMMSQYHTFGMRADATRPE